ncbi:MAG: DUF3943 domain-containing protein [Bacteroidales bacterium]|nr:DUF3943 domain-containing protein [Bacteroidales bacterium]
MKRSLYILIIISALLSVAIPARAQMPIKLSVADTVPPDTADLAYYGKKHFWRASAELVGFNLSLWAFDRYVQKGDFSYISFKTIAENFKHGFKWDNDKLGTNMFLHPYTGNLYYNTGRSNGFNFWQSSLYAIAGSAMWELFMECEYPSTNDIIATPIGGIAIGEVAYRASDAVLDDRATGWSRFGREAGAFVINPMRGLTRILNGDAWRHRPTSGKQFGTPNVGVEFSIGPKAIEFRHDGVNDYKIGGCIDFNMEYGDRFEVHSKLPYDYFTVHANLNVIASQPVLSQLTITGRLLARELLDSRQKQDLSLGIYQHFDYFDSDTISRQHHKCPFKLGVPASIGVGMMYRNMEHPRTTFDAYAHFNAVLLGSILSDYYHLDERNYNWAMGMSGKVGIQAVWGGDKYCISLSTALYRLYTFKGYPQGTDMRTADRRLLNAMGDHSEATFGITQLSAQMRLHDHLYLGLEAAHYYRATHYRDFPHVNSSTFTQSLKLIYKL